MQMIRRTSRAILGLGVAFTIFWGVADPMAAFAEVRVIEADGYYIMGDGPEENAAVAKERVRADARRAATLSLGIKGRYHSYPSFPWNDLIHLLQKIFTFRHSFPMTVLALRHDKHLLTPVNSYMSIVSYDRTFEKSGNKSVFP